MKCKLYKKYLKAMKKIGETGYSGATAIEAMNWDYKDLSIEEFLREAFERGKRLEALKLSYKPIYKEK